MSSEMREYTQKKWDDSRIKTNIYERILSTFFWGRMQKKREKSGEYKEF